MSIEITFTFINGEKKTYEFPSHHSFLEHLRMGHHHFGIITLGDENEKILINSQHVMLYEIKTYTTEAVA